MNVILYLDKNRMIRGNGNQTGKQGRLPPDFCKFQYGCRKMVWTALSGAFARRNRGKEKSMEVEKGKAKGTGKAAKTGAV